MLNTVRSKRLIILLTLVCLCWSMGMAQQTAVDLSAPLPTDPAVKIGKLPNGMTYYIRKNKEPENRIELRLAVNAGSLLETDAQQGLAHLLEHMAFNGTTHFKKNDLVDYLESIGTKFGAHLNAYTSFDETVYMLQIPADKKDILDKSFIVLQDWAQGLTLDPQEVDKERGVVIEEWRIGRGADARMRDKWFPVVFKNSRYAERLPIGKKEILETFPHEVLRQFYTDWYRPDLMAVLVVGDIDPAAIEAKIQATFSPLKNPPNPKPREVFRVPDHSEPLVSVVTDKENPRTVAQLIYKLPKAPQTTHGDYRAYLVRALYNQILNQRLQELLQDPDPPFMFGMSNYSDLVRTKDAFFSIALTKEDEVLRGIRTLVQENERVSKYGIVPTELERAKIEYLSMVEKMYKERDKTESSNLIREYIQHFLAEGNMPGIAYEYELTQKFLPTITVEELNTLAKRLVSDKNMVAVITMPEKEGLKPPTEAEVLKTIQEAKSADLKPYVDKVGNKPLMEKPLAQGKIVSFTENKTLDYTEWKLQNGIRVIFKKTDFKNDEIQFGAFSPGGLSVLPDADYNSGTVADAILEECGLSEFDKITLQKMLAGKVVSCSPNIDELFEGMSGSCSPKDLETLGQLINLYFTKPRKDAKAFASWMTRTVNSLKNRDKSPETAFYDKIQETLFKNHPRRQPFNETYLKKVELDKAMQIYKDRFADASDFTFVFVGAIDPIKLRSMVTTYLATLPALNRNESWKDNNITTVEGVVTKTVKKGMEQKSTVALVFTGQHPIQPGDALLADATARILSIKLREQLREEKSGVYGVGSYVNLAKYPKARFRSDIRFPCDPKNADDLIKTALEQVKILQDKGPEAKDLQKVQETLRREHETNLKENDYWLGYLVNTLKNGDDPEQLLKKPELIDAITAEKIQAMAKRYFPLNNYLQVVLLPEKTQ